MRNLLCLILGVAALAGEAAADQTDSRLDLLFEELRTGEAARAEENIARIIDIWSDAASDTVDILYARAEASMAAAPMAAAPSRNCLRVTVTGIILNSWCLSISFPAISRLLPVFS